MSIEENLRLFGLNKYEALAFMTLVKKGVSTAKEISKFAGVPYSRVYDTLDSLEKKGWIVVESGKPMRCKAVDIKSALTETENRTKARLEKARKEITKELEPFFDRGIKKLGVWTIRGEKNVVEKVREMVETAEKSIELVAPYIPEEFSEDAEKIYNLILQKIKRGIRVKSIVGEGMLKGRKISGLVDLRVCKEKMGWIVIKDGEEVFYASPFSEKTQEKLGMWTDEPEIVNTSVVMFKYMWRGSEKLDLKST